MRVPHIVLAITLLLVGFATRAQDVIYSPYEKFDFRNGEFSVVGMTGGLLYCYQNAPEGSSLVAFDDSMNKVATIILDFFPSKLYSSRFIAYSDKILILYQALESNKVVQYVALLDEHARLVGRPMQLGMAKPGIFGPMKSYFYSNVSEDKKTVIVYSINSKSKSIELDCKWLDDSGKVQKRSKAIYKPDRDMSTSDVLVANTGKVYLGAYTTVGMQDYADRFTILGLEPGNNKFEEHPMPLEQKYVTRGYLKADNVNGKLYFGGFYSGMKNGGYDGALFASFNVLSAEFEQLKFLPFDDEMRQKAGTTPTGYPHSFDNYLVKQIIVKNDGGFVMVSENSFVTSRAVFTPGLGYYSSFYSPYNNTSTVREYHYNDIMVLSYNAEGKNEWSSFVYKTQFSQEDGGIFSSYGLLNSGGSLAFLYNDFNTRQSRIQLATVDVTGKVQTNSFTAEGNNYPDWLPSSGKQVAGRVYVVPCLRGRQICYAKVVF